ncbi:hypothetical protein [Streptomyces sp. NBC_00658]|uniref:hypothetical protein n=1 Tax=Streptomyces sp. NBC_00658 TaxID=2975800 RepID=UPI00324FFDDE
MKPADWITLAAVLIALLTLITSSASAARARVKTIEEAYVARYWQILDRFPPKHSSAYRAAPLCQRTLKEPYAST